MVCNRTFFASLTLFWTWSIRKEASFLTVFMCGNIFLSAITQTYTFLNHEIFGAHFLGARTDIPVSKIFWLRPCVIKVLLLFVTLNWLTHLLPMHPFSTPSPLKKKFRSCYQKLVSTNKLSNPPRQRSKSVTFCYLSKLIQSLKQQPQQRQKQQQK